MGSSTTLFPQMKPPTRVGPKLRSTTSNDGSNVEARELGIFVVFFGRPCANLLAANTILKSDTRQERIMSDETPKAIPIKNLRQEDGASDLARSANMEPYLRYI